LITRLARHQPRLTSQDAAACVDEILGAIVSQLGAGERVEIRGFGSFAVGKRAPRICRNPKTSDKVAVPAKWTVRFKAGMELRDRVDCG
jgi:integration host factor subunit beta